VDHNGRPLTNESVSTRIPDVGTFVEEDPLHVIAARQHAKDSTKKDTNKQS